MAVSGKQARYVTRQVLDSKTGRLTPPYIVDTKNGDKVVKRFNHGEEVAAKREMERLNGAA